MGSPYRGASRDTGETKIRANENYWMSDAL
jgi:hypothetical protein